jgi:hypothetical protein
MPGSGNPEKKFYRNKVAAIRKFMNKFIDPVMLYSGQYIVYII